MSDARGAIENLLYTYAERIDAGDFEGVAALFEGAVITVEGSEDETRGREAVQRLYETTTRIYQDDGTPKTRHITSNAIVEIDEEAGSARCRSVFTVLQCTPDLPLQPIISGRYHDTFVREGVREGVRGGHAWRFASRHMLLDLFGDLSQHLLFDTGRLR
jgi:3-phenylpropionate/cinnamic acid dioxygenase small subunit